ncbi:hypothetical protein G1H11_16560 [Phytoactinopolyspora alkaliphila]|uniref:Uncharacterized protein n=1 Tax=Phytoactinopolyspora alkaliphila TaxID=1783498 RepID=A0A6N9YPR0_9ACTN|nr:hypothetical protein [Phytoactinopolyspora alkaliphila]NED96920.1 hypothetical protein [Phytoactinopolyspora alkaliphila]
MSVLRFFTGISWWAWTTMLGVAMLMLVLGLGWFPLFVVIVGWLLVVLLRDENEAAGHQRPGRQAEDEAGITLLAGAPPHVVKPAIARASNEQLCEIWQRSGVELRQAYLPATIAAHADLRHMVLDEMQRRDPEAFDRWLADRPHQCDPRTYLGSL